MPAISVKVKTVKLIKALEDKVRELKDELAENDKKVAAHEQAEKKHEQAMQKYASKMATKLGLKPTVATREQAWDNTVIVSLSYSIPSAEMKDAPKLEPVEVIRPWEKAQAEEKIQEMENAIRLLKMTDEETVGASTYKSVSKYL